MPYNYRMRFLEVMETEFWGNDVEAYAIALFLFLAYNCAFWLFRKYFIAKIHAWSEQSHAKFDNVVVKSLTRIPTYFYVLVAFYLATESLHLEPTFHKFLNLIFVTLVIFQIISALQGTIYYLLESSIQSRKRDKTDYTLIYGAKLLINMVLWIIAILLVLSNWGVNVNSLVASLGIGGIAIALAVQNLLGDMFSAFSIYSDKPFRVGDFIISGDHMGTVNKIGLKSTRIQALQGEEIVIPNKELTSGRVQNFKKMKERRVSWLIHVSHETNAAQCRMIPDMIKDILKSFEELRVDYVALKEIGISSLMYETIFYYPSGDYNEYMAKQNLLNLRIKEDFEKAGIHFAIPMQTVNVSSNKK